METEAIATKLQAFLERRLGTKVPVVSPGSPGHGPRLLHKTESYGDPYSGSTYYDSLMLEGADPLHVHFEMGEHDLSGQCDRWTAEVSGARADERDAFAELFHPRNRRGHWGANATVSFTFNGVAGEF